MRIVKRKIGMERMSRRRVIRFRGRVRGEFDCEGVAAEAEWGEDGDDGAGEGAMSYADVVDVVAVDEKACCAA